MKRKCIVVGFTKHRLIVWALAHKRPPQKKYCSLKYGEHYAVAISPSWIPTKIIKRLTLGSVLYWQTEPSAWGGDILCNFTTRGTLPVLGKRCRNAVKELIIEDRLGSEIRTKMVGHA